MRWWRGQTWWRWLNEVAVGSNEVVVVQRGGGGVERGGGGSNEVVAG